MFVAKVTETADLAPFDAGIVTMPSFLLSTYMYSLVGARPPMPVNVVQAGEVYPPIQVLNQEVWRAVVLLVGCSILW